MSLTTPGLSSLPEIDLAVRPRARPLSMPDPSSSLPTLGPHVVQWIEENCCYGGGDVEGRPVKMRPWQKHLAYNAYELRGDGQRLYRQWLLETAKAQGKTPINAWFGLYELVHRHSPRIMVAATSTDQAGLLFGDMKACVDASPALQKQIDAYAEALVLKGRPGRADAVSSRAGTKDGQRPSVYAADELHLLVGKLEELYRTIARGIAKRDDGVIGISTTPGERLDSLLGRLHNEGLAWNAGDRTGTPICFVWYGLDVRYNELLDLEDPEQRAYALRLACPAADDFMDVANYVGLWSTMPEHEYRRYHLGQWWVGDTAFFPEGAWAKVEDANASRIRRENVLLAPPHEQPWPGIEPGRSVVLGFDGSWSQDSTALIVLDLQTRTFGVVGLWEKPFDAVRWTVPKLEVLARLRQCFTRWDVREVMVDRYLWATDMQELALEDFPITEMPQGEQATAAATLFYGNVVADQSLRHDGDPRLARHLSNATAVSVQGGVRMAKADKKSPLKIDAGAAALNALWSAHLIAGTEPEPGMPSVIDLDDYDLD